MHAYRSESAAAGAPKQELQWIYLLNTDIYHYAALNEILDSEDKKSSNLTAFSLWGIDTARTPLWFTYLFQEHAPQCLPLIFERLPRPPPDNLKTSI
jgi:hypothetical protein